MAELKKEWRVVDILKWSKDYLGTKGVESPQVEAEWLIREVLDCSRIDVYMNHARPFSKAEKAQFKKLLLERISGKPLQYVLGYTEFMGLRINLTPDVLIPRPETEIIVEKTIEFIKQRKIENPYIFDACTGSGNIAISLASFLKECSVLAVDISKKALDVALQNSLENSVSEKIKFRESDILNNKFVNEQFDVIISNPPYVAGKWYQNLPKLVKNYEPRIALDPGEDEFIFYKHLAIIGEASLSDYGIICVEIGGTYQEEMIKEIFAKSALSCFYTLKDYSGHSRAIFAQKDL